MVEYVPIEADVVVGQNVLGCQVRAVDVGFKTAEGREAQPRRSAARQLETGGWYSIEQVVGTSVLRALSMGHFGLMLSGGVRGGVKIGTSV